MSNRATKVASIIGIIVGIVILILGLFIQNVSYDTESTESIGKSIKFGADFYTEMYDVTRDTGLAVNNTTKAINNAVEVLSKICAAIGWLIVSIGAADISFFVHKLCCSIAGNGTNNLTANEEQTTNGIHLISTEKNTQKEGQNVSKSPDLRRWEAAQHDQGIFIGNCTKCGAQQKELIHAQFESLVGKAEGDICYDCFCKYNATSKL